MNLWFQVFADLLDPIIKERHNGYDSRTMTHPTDLDSSKVRLSPDAHTVRRSHSRHFHNSYFATGTHNDSEAVISTGRSTQTCVRQRKQ